MGLAMRWSCACRAGQSIGHDLSSATSVSDSQRTIGMGLASRESASATSMANPLSALLAEYDAGMPSEQASGGSQGRSAAAERVGAKTRSVTTKSQRMRVGTASSPTPPATDASEAVTTLRSALSVITTVGTPLTIITALMLYFGWARSNAQSSWMGIDVSLFHFSVQDYVLRSISTLFVPLLVACGVGIAWLEIHRRICAVVDPANGSPRVRAAGTIIMSVGIATAIASVVLASMKLEWRAGPVVVPLLLAAGTAFGAYGRRLVRLGGGAEAAVSSVPHWQSLLQDLLVGAVIALAVFWAVGAYAGIVGRGIGQDIEQTVGALPRATAISEAPLGIDAPNVATNAITVGTRTLYRTTGLRLLGESGRRLFLLNDGWSRRSGSIIVLEEDKSVHWQFGH